MNEQDPITPGAIRSDADDLPELELSDDDILDAMRRIPGYLTSRRQTFAPSTTWPTDTPSTDSSVMFGLTA